MLFGSLAADMKHIQSQLKMFLTHRILRSPELKYQSFSSNMCSAGPNPGVTPRAVSFGGIWLSAHLQQI